MADINDGDQSGHAWPERISPWREIMWMVACIALGLLVIPAALAVPAAWAFNSESVFIWLLIGGAVVGGVIAFKLYKRILRKRAAASGRYIRFRDGILTLPAQDPGATPETRELTGADAGWYRRHGGSNSGTIEFLWLLVESSRGKVLLTTEGESLRGDWLQNVSNAEPDREKTRDARLTRMFGSDLAELIRLVNKH